MDRKLRLSNTRSTGWRPWIRGLGLGLTVAAAGLALGTAAPTSAVAQVSGTSMSVPLAPDAPSQYVVKKGDTLWDIAGVFLRDPWFWPEIWYVNPQVANPHLIYPGDVLALIWVDGQPRVVLERGGATRLSPRVREQPLSEAIRAIPWDIVQAYMSKPTVLAKEQIEAAPYVVTGRDQRLVTSSGDRIYARRMDSAAVGQSWMAYQVGQKLEDPESGDVLGYEGVYASTGTVKATGDPATLLIVKSTRETEPGHVLVPEQVEFNMDFIPHPPSGNIEGVIMAVTDDPILYGEFQVAVINRGSRDGLEAGNVLSIWDLPEEVKDDTKYRESSKVTLPGQNIGRYIVFKTWERMSYGLVLDSRREMQIGYVVKNP